MFKLIFFRNELFFIILLLSFANCQSDSQKKEVFLKPNSYGCDIVIFENGLFHTIDRLPIPEQIDCDEFKNPRDTMPDCNPYQAELFDDLNINQSGWITYIYFDKTRIALFKLDENSCVLQYPDLVMPDGKEVFCTVFKNDILYVGGVGSTKEIVAYYDLSKTEPTWTPLVMPEQLTKRGKRIDGLHVNGNKLIAVDNVIMPKWFVIYDISSPLEPTLCDVVRIKPHGVYEGISKTVLYNDFLITQSTTSGRMDWSQHITIYNSKSLEELRVLNNSKSAFRLSGYQELQKDTSVTWYSIAASNNCLLIAAGKHGIGKVNLKDLNLKTIHQDSLISYTRPEFIGNGRVLNIIPHLGTGSASIVISKNNDLVSVLYDIK